MDRQWIETSNGNLLIDWDKIWTDVDNRKGGFKLTRTSLEISESVPFEEWLQFGQQLAVWEGAFQFWIGDFLNYGERKYGETYAQAVDPRQAETWKHYAWVARAIEKCTRVHVLSYSHHRIVARLTPSEQIRWLDEAVSKHLSVAGLHRAIQDDTIRQSGDIEERTNSIAEIAYLAGYFDADGGLYNFQGRYWTVHITSTDVPFFEWLQNTFPQFNGGTVLLTPSSHKDGYNRKKAYNWVIRRRASVRTFLSMVEPYSINKRERIRTALEELAVNRLEQRNTYKRRQQAYLNNDESKPS